MTINSIILRALLVEWIHRLNDTIDRLEDTLPLERKFKTDTQRIAAASLSNLFATPETHPDLFAEIEVPQPFEDLDELRHLVDAIRDVVDALGQAGEQAEDK